MAIETFRRPEIWRLAKWLQARFGIATDWPACDKHGWYQTALDVHNEVYRNGSPHVQHDIPVEAQIASARISRTTA